MPLSAAALATALALLLSGCQRTVNARSAEALVTGGIESHSHLTVKEASCPTDVSAQAGATFQCTAKTDKRGRFILTVAILDDRGNLKVIDLKPATRVQIQGLSG
jgi:Domain of unknown function (DUF4333)